MLGYENGISHPAIRLWNDTHHVFPSKVEDAPTNSYDRNEFANNEVTR
jgi:hypothetical protein